MAYVQQSITTPASPPSILLGQNCSQASRDREELIRDEMSKDYEIKSSRAQLQPHIIIRPPDPVANPVCPLFPSIFSPTGSKVQKKSSRASS